MEQSHILKYYLVKFFYILKGLVKYTFFFKKNHKYFGGIRQSPSIYRGNCLFYETLHGQCGYVTVFNSRNKKYKLWELGFFKWRKIYG